MPPGGQIHRHNDKTKTDFIICPMLYGIAMGQIIINILTNIASKAEMWFSSTWYLLICSKHFIRQLWKLCGYLLLVQTYHRLPYVGLHKNNRHIVLCVYYYHLFSLLQHSCPSGPALCPWPTCQSCQCSATRTISVSRNEYETCFRLLTKSETMCITSVTLACMQSIVHLSPKETGRHVIISFSYVVWSRSLVKTGLRPTTSGCSNMTKCTSCHVPKLWEPQNLGGALYPYTTYDPKFLHDALALITIYQDI